MAKLVHVDKKSNFNKDLQKEGSPVQDVNHEKVMVERW